MSAMPAMRVSCSTANRRLERVLWSALRAHRERSVVLRRLGADARARKNVLAARRWEDLAAEHERDAEVILNLVSARSPPEISSINGDI
jgi:hypothetical protein